MKEPDVFTSIAEPNRDRKIETPLHEIPSNANKVGKERRALSPRRQAKNAHFWPSGPPDYVSKEPLEQSYEEIWEEIERNKTVRSDDFIRVYCAFARPPTLENVMTWRRTWSSWSYEGAYPHFSKFLKSVDKEVLARCTIFIEDFDMPRHNALGRVKNKRYLFKNFAYNELWETMKKRPLWHATSMHVDGMQDIATSTFRLIQITDLSPMVLTCILGSTPK